VILIGGTGTSIGKTHFAEALLHAWRQAASAVGLKPVESGVVHFAGSDAARLAAASSFHVKHSAFVFAAPLSPHLAARDEGAEIHPDAIVELVRDVRTQADAVVVELAGGLFSPLTNALSNADLAVRLAPDTLLLVAPDRLGVLHDVAATTRAASTVPLRIDGIVLLAPEHADPSTGRNAGELPHVTTVPVLGVLPRGAPTELARLPAMGRIVKAIAEGRPRGR